MPILPILRGGILSLAFTFLSVESGLAFCDKTPKVSLISSSTAVDESLWKPIQTVLTKAGYEVTERYFKQVRSDFGYVNTDKARADQLVASLLDDSIDIVWFMIGGGGAMNLLPYLDERKQELKAARPKYIVGFSDVTAIHLWLNENLNWPTVHGVLGAFNTQMAEARHKEEPSLNDLQGIPWIPDLACKGLTYDTLVPLNAAARKGAAGELRGGNLTLNTTSISTPWEMAYEGKLLIVEDVGTTPHHLDRVLHQLRFKKGLNVEGIVFGQFYSLEPTDEQRLIYKSVIEDFADNFQKPVYYFPYFGHGRYNKPFLLGHQARIDCGASDGYCTLKQPPVAKKASGAP